MSEELWTIVAALAKQAVIDVERCLGFDLPEGDRAQVPLFPDLDVVRTVNSLNEYRSLLMTDKLNIAAAEVTKILKLVSTVSNVRSERTGASLAVNARRFRYTTGTRAAYEGFGKLVIAELLDHSDTQNADVYIKYDPGARARLDAAVGAQLAVYAQAFTGVLVDSERDAKRGDDPSSRIRTDAGTGIGTCGEYGFCGANVPIPCYTCMHFQPWLDGPHHEVYSSLLKERERLIAVTEDSQVPRVLDRTIIAVAEVIQRCDSRRAELNAQRVVLNG